MIDVLVVKITTTNYHGDTDINTRLVVRVKCKQSIEEEDQSSFGDIKRRVLQRELNQLKKVIIYLVLFAECHFKVGFIY